MRGQRSQRFMLKPLINSAEGSATLIFESESRPEQRQMVLGLDSSRQSLRFYVSLMSSMAQSDLNFSWGLTYIHNLYSSLRKGTKRTVLPVSWWMTARQSAYLTPKRYQKVDSCQTRYQISSQFLQRVSMPFQRLMEASSGLDSFSLERKRCLSLRWRSGVTLGVLTGYNCIGYYQALILLNRTVTSSDQRHQIHFVLFYSPHKSVNGQFQAGRRPQCHSRIIEQLKVMNENKFIIAVRNKFGQYIEKVNLTEQAKARTHELISQLNIIHLIYLDTSGHNRNIILEKLKEVETVLDARLKGQGWMTFFSRTSEVVSLDQTWRAIRLFQNEPRQHLINDICTLKKGSWEPNQSKANI